MCLSVPGCIAVRNLTQEPLPSLGRLGKCQQQERVHSSDHILRYSIYVGGSWHRVTSLVMNRERQRQLLRKLPPPSDVFGFSKVPKVLL